MKNLILAFLEHAVVTALCFLAIPVAFYVAGYLPAEVVHERPVLILFVAWVLTVAALIALYLAIARLIGRVAPKRNPRRAMR
ncbi:hypothetical protein [Aquamicrobium sp. LC103]|uniref:hypothetical protein n=1 Tax=Aquamicrobium sp. LC103 TaxID=1120658 RepID=UPI00063EB6BE|nr:hypothetical protein [Aquamicrobium sp. LC103]TKT74420.1 hypothetical protein XW59_023555 [Aquamicrobium sp. LC103]